MMVTFCCFECGTAWRILFPITCCLSLLRFLSCQICGEVPHNSAPSVKITTSPTVNTLVYGSSLNLTCTARVTRKRLPYEEKYNKPCEIEWWLTGGKMVHRCKLKDCLHASSVMYCTLTLGGSHNELNSSGNFTCKASNGNNECTRQKIEIKPLFVSGLQKPEITPLNQSARIGSNVTFLCTVGGHPRPVISWSRTANNSDTFNESNSRIRIKTNVKRGQSHLIIAEITEYYYGIYFCSAKNILGEKVSNPAVLWQTTVAKPTKYSVKSRLPAKIRELDLRVMPIIFGCIFGTLGIGSVVYFLWYRKLRRRIAEAQERDNTAGKADAFRGSRLDTPRGTRDIGELL